MKNKSEIQELLAELMRLCLLMDKDIDKTQRTLNGLKKKVDSIENRILKESNYECDNHGIGSVGDTTIPP